MWKCKLYYLWIHVAQIHSVACGLEKQKWFSDFGLLVVFQCVFQYLCADINLPWTITPCGSSQGTNLARSMNARTSKSRDRNLSSPPTSAISRSMATIAHPVPGPRSAQLLAEGDDWLGGLWKHTVKWNLGCWDRICAMTLLKDLDSKKGQTIDTSLQDVLGAWDGSSSTTSSHNFVNLLMATGKADSQAARHQPVLRLLKQCCQI